MSGFWEVHSQNVPEGYEHFSQTHVLTLLACAAFGLALFLLFRKSGKRNRWRMIRAIPVIMVCMEAFKELNAFVHGVDMVGYLPLHLCGLGVFVFLLAAYLPRAKAKAFFAEVSLFLILPGSVAALLFPDWTMLYSPLSYMSINSYVWHTLLCVYPLMLSAEGIPKPSIKHIWYHVVFLAVVVPPVYIFDVKYNCNYMFLTVPVPDTPLEWLASFMGNPGYLAGYAILIFAVILAEYLVFEALTRVGRYGGKRKK